MQLLDEAQVLKAVEALLKYIEKQRASSKQNLLEEDELLYMVGCRLFVLLPYRV